MAAPRLDPWQWRDLLLQEIHLPRAVVATPVHEAVGHVLAEGIHSPEDLPAAPIAAMDGFAVRRADLTPGTCTLPVGTEIAARPGTPAVLTPGTAARIMTGAPVPEGADAVIEVEATDTDPFGPTPRTVSFTLDAVPPLRRHIRRPGEEIARGQELARPGDLVGAGLVGLVRALGLRELPIQRPLRVAIVVTGDELTGDDPTGATANGPTDGASEVPAPEPGTVRESNGAMLGAALHADGAEARAFHSGDAPEELRSTLEAASEHHDLVLTTGGIGHGAFDVVKALLGERGTGSSRFEHVALRPGGPQGFGHLPDGTPVIHLPGTPVGALVGYHLFVRPLLAGSDAEPRRVLRGAVDPGDGLLASTAASTAASVTASTAASTARRADHVQALPGRLRRDADGREVVDLLPGRRLAPYGRADAIVLDGGPDRPVPDGPVPDGKVSEGPVSNGLVTDGPVSGRSVVDSVVDGLVSDDGAEAATVLVVPL
ncbi:molybdopterin molybdotransferase MoeA [Brachybacterium sp. AOP3-A1-3]|uniref:molybdopterin molybdotransferase MoeA n=1 Tax=Brachybacterium sp. AOP3-A1-3 TaxID=3457699 RepID=UPI00403410D1